MNKSLIFIVFFLSLLRPVAFSQPALDFNGETDHVILNGSDFAAPWTLVAPVYKDLAVRDSIYLPAGRWFAYRAVFQS